MRTSTSLTRSFQCHHGVPAWDTAGVRSRLGVGFNATTAFLLVEVVELPNKFDLGFNATTAFLLSGGSA